MYIVDKLEEIVQSYNKSNIISNKKVYVEFDYEDLIHVILALREENSRNNEIIKAYELNS